MRDWVFLAMALCCGCKQSPVQPAQTGTTTVETADVVVSPLAVGDAAMPEVAPEAVTSLVTRWNEAHVKHDATALAALYAEVVYFFGKTLPRTECSRLKSEAFAKAADYTQVANDVTVTERGDRWVVSLTKSWTASGRTTETPTVLYLDKHDRITAEMDRPTTIGAWGQTTSRTVS
jgi:ketosteroid isomerase-like protein